MWSESKEKGRLLAASSGRRHGLRTNSVRQQEEVHLVDWVHIRTLVSR